MKFNGWPRKTIEHFFYTTSSVCASYQIHWWIQTGLTVQKCSIRIEIGDVIPFDLEIWWMTLENNRAHLLCYLKLCAAFRSHWWIQTGVTVRKRPIWVKLDDFLSRATLKFDRWPCKTIGHLFYATSSFVQHFISIGDLKFQLQSGNAQFGSKSTIFLAVWPRNFTDDPRKQ